MDTLIRPADESGMEWSGEVDGREFRASGSFSLAVGHLSIYEHSREGSASLLGTVTWHGVPTQRMTELAKVLTMLASELEASLGQVTAAQMRGK